MSKQEPELEQGLGRQRLALAVQMSVRFMLVIQHKIHNIRTTTQLQHFNTTTLNISIYYAER